MTTVFNTFFRDQLFATPTLLDAASVGIRLFRSAPSFSANDARYIGINLADDLAVLSGWSEVVAPGYPLATTVGVSRRVNPPASANNYILLSSFPFTGLGSSAEAKAVVYYYNGTVGGVVKPIIMITDTPFDGQRTVVRGVDALTSNPDTSMAGANRWLFSWATPAGGAPSTALIQKEGPLAVLHGAPAFETSHTQHVWLYPQRVNLIANPSFEKDTAYWLSNGTITRVAESALGVGSWAGRFTGPSGGGAVVAESNIFDTQFEERWTVQLMVKGTGNLKVGFIWWDGSFIETAVDWGTETWKLDPVNYTRVAVARTGYQTFQGMIRLECDGGNLTIDNVLVEKGYLKDWPYFDGDTTYGARDDYSWYGGSVRQGASYSLWYNNKRATYGRLFARDIEGVVVVTDEVMTQQGFVYQWVPAGTTVLPHIDVLYPNDLQLPPASRSGSVLPYRIVPTNLQGVTYPWKAAALSLPGSPGSYVSTPDAAQFDITGDLCLLVKATPATWAANGMLIAKWATSTTRSYEFSVNSSGTLRLQWSADGAAIITRTSAAHNFTLINTPKWIAATLDVDNGASGHDVKFWISDNGTTWVQLGTTITTAGVTSIFASTSPVEVGTDSAGTNMPYSGLIHGARIYNGIGNNTAPGLGTIVGHFRTGVPTTVNTYTDEFGNVWTVNGVRYVPTSFFFPGQTMNYLTAPDNNRFDFTGNWGAVVNLIGGVANNAYLVGKAASTGVGNLDWLWNVNGATHQISWIDNTATLRTITMAGSPLLNTHPWWGVNFQLANGAGASAGKVFWSDDGVTWTLATSSTLSYAPQTMRAGTQILQCMGRVVGGTIVTGELRAMRVYSGIGDNSKPGLGTLVADVPCYYLWLNGTASDPQSNLWTLVGGPSGYVTP